MAESKTVTVVPLSSTNYSTWKIQCKMALIRDGLWGIVNETETAPTEGAEAQAKFAARRDKALHDYCVGDRAKLAVSHWRRSN